MPMMALLTVLAAASAAPSGADAGLCGLEEVNRPELKSCPAYNTYDEDGEVVSGGAAASTAEQGSSGA